MFVGLLRGETDALRRLRPWIEDLTDSMVDDVRSLQSDMLMIQEVIKTEGQLELRKKERELQELRRQKQSLEQQLRSR